MCLSGRKKLKRTPPMSDLGKCIRLKRIFSHPSGRLVSVAVDHFLGYAGTMTEGLRDLGRTIDILVQGRPDAMTMFHGTARNYWKRYAGEIPLIVQVGCFTADDRVMEELGTAEEVIRLGADAIAVAIGVRGPTEGKHLAFLSRTVLAAEAWGLPTIAHIYPRDYGGDPVIVHDAENVAWAVRCGIECGADVIKVAYTGCEEEFRDIISMSPVPVVGAGGPQTRTLVESLKQAREMIAAGARGMTIGRNIWATKDPALALRAFKGVIHDGACAELDPELLSDVRREE
jgi:class I fructose-bisphosphate aldolase